ncbi:MAG: hypothetical protein KBT39_08850 [Bacteroidales bacterium]|nr:hypothetical protein [Bacteroidales bacterium]
MKKILEYLTARSEKGIKIRLWFAILMSVAALLFNVLCISPEFDRLPQEVPLLFDVEGNVSVWGHKSMITDFAGLRALFFVVMSFIGWAICRGMGNSLLGKRIRLLVIDIANLVVTTCVAMTLVYMEIAKGDLTQKLSEHWEYAIMLFWIVVFIIEFITDKKHLK